MAEHEKVLLTKSGIEKLRQERDLLVNVERPKVIADLQAARAQGDLSENADYDAARERQAQVEARIRDLEVMIANALIIDEKEAKGSKKKVKLGSTVRILDMDTNEEEEYTIVGSTEVNIAENKISNESPLGKALMGRKVGDNIEVNAQAGVIEYEVLKIDRSI